MLVKMIIAIRLHKSLVFSRCLSHVNHVDFHPGHTEVAWRDEDMAMCFGDDDSRISRQRTQAQHGKFSCRKPGFLVMGYCGDINGDISL